MGQIHIESMRSHQVAALPNSLFRTKVARRARVDWVALRSPDRVCPRADLDGASAAADSTRLRGNVDYNLSRKFSVKIEFIR